jgi:2,4-dienoyl-CoA reductase-like NADH-dependent reductase (Old Yellow Enzyme family)
VDLPLSIDPFAPARLGPVTLRNRVIKAATFEGRSPKNVVTDALIDFHREVAAGGVGMTTVAFCAVSRDGRSAPGEIVLVPEAVPGLRRLTDAVHAEGAAACAQVGHAGPVAGAGQRGIAPSPVFSPMAMKRMRAATGADIARITREFARAATCAVEAGFDAIELHLGHGYLLSAFMSPKLNRRTDGYGGNVEKRARLPREVARAVRDAVGDTVALTAKFNMADGVRGGLDVDESVEIARMLQEDRTLDALELTGGSSFANPMYLFRGDRPLAEMAAAMPGMLKIGFKVAGRYFLRAYPFEEAYFLPMARRFRAALTMPLILLGGINRMDTINAAMNEGFEFVAMARALLREPDLVNKLKTHTSSEALCIHCNKCMPTIYRGTHCVLVPEAAARAEAGPTS